MGINVPKERASMSSRFPSHVAEPEAAKGGCVAQVQAGSTPEMLVPDASAQDDAGKKSSRPIRLITRAELCSIVPYTPQHILRLEKRGLFPRRVQVGANRVAWLLSEIEDWIAARAAERKRLGS